MDYKIVFQNKTIVSKQEITEIFESLDFLNDYDVVVMGEGLSEGEFELTDVLMNPEIKLFAICSNRRGISEFGGRNSLIAEGAEYECLCRIADSKASHFFLPCASDEIVTINDSGEYTKMLAYVMRKYMTSMKSIGKLDDVFIRFLSFAKKMKEEELFSSTMKQYLEDDSEIKNIAKETNPILIISGDETCYNVLQDFSNSLADALVDAGCAVVTTNGKYGSYNNGEILGTVDFKAIIGFQAPVLKKDFFKKMDCKKFLFWFDNPLFSPEEFEGLDDNYFFLCQDMDYAKHITKYYGVKNAIQLSPGGVSIGLENNIEREYDLVFIGTYYSHEKDILVTDEEKAFYDFMLCHPTLNYEAGLMQHLKEIGEWEKYANNSKAFLELLCGYHVVCRKVMHQIRGKIMSTILQEGIKVDVFGDTWKEFDLPGKENLILHPVVSPEKSLEIWGHSKIGLNVMTWHKAGMTERIANIMMSGAVCLTDETEYLRDNFDDSEICTFSLEEIDKVPAQVRALLEDSNRREKIAKNAFEKCVQKESWADRASRIIALI